MKVLFDTSVLIAALLNARPRHLIAIKCLGKANEKTIDGYGCTHAHSESYSIFTLFSIYPKISPSAAKTLLFQNILNNLKIIELDGENYKNIIEGLEKIALVVVPPTMH